MQKATISMLILLCVGVATGLVAYAQQDLKIQNVEIYPTPAGVAGPNIALQASRSYRFTVTVMKSVALQQGSSFIVRTECLRDGKRLVIGEARVGDTKGWHIYATYDVFPGEAGVGNCMLRTTVDADNEINELDKSAVSNTWDRSAIIEP